MSKGLLCLLGLLALGAHSEIRAADGPSAPRPQGGISVEVVFTDDEIRIIRAHYRSHGGSKGKRKHKAKGLPPGIAKNLARGKPLPPGIAKQGLPAELRRALPPVPDRHERIVVAGKILLIEIATQIVRDILTDTILD